MSKIHSDVGDEMRPEYDFSGGVRGKYFSRYQASSNVVVLDPDVSVAFPNATAVNDALRMLAALAERANPAAEFNNNRMQRTSARAQTKPARARR